MLVPKGFHQGCSTVYLFVAIPSRRVPPDDAKPLTTVDRSSAAKLAVVYRCAGGACIPHLAPARPEHPCSASSPCASKRCTNCADTVRRHDPARILWCRLPDGCLLPKRLPVGKVSRSARQFFPLAAHCWPAQCPGSFRRPYGIVVPAPASGFSDPFLSAQAWFAPIAGKSPTRQFAGKTASHPNHARENRAPASRAIQDGWAARPSRQSLLSSLRVLSQKFRTTCGSP